MSPTRVKKDISIVADGKFFIKLIDIINIHTYRLSFKDYYNLINYQNIYLIMQAVYN